MPTFHQCLLSLPFESIYYRYWREVRIACEVVASSLSRSLRALPSRCRTRLHQPRASSSISIKMLAEFDMSRYRPSWPPSAQNRPFVDGDDHLLTRRNAVIQHDKVAILCIDCEAVDAAHGRADMPGWEWCIRFGVGRNRPIGRQVRVNYWADFVVGRFHQSALLSGLAAKIPAGH